MDSMLNGVPLSTTQGSPPLTTGIRAPLTIDDSDFDYSFSKSGQSYTTPSPSNSYYGSDTEGGFVSGGDEFETASERALVDDQNFSVFRPLVKIPDDEILSSVGDFDDSRSFLTDEYTDNSAIQGIPIAQLSWDSEEEDYRSTGVPEDIDVTGAVKTPIPVVLECAPKDKVSDVSNGEEDESEFENVIQSGMVEDLALTENVKMVSGSDSKEQDKVEIESAQNFTNEGDGADVTSKESISLGLDLCSDSMLLAETSQILDSSTDAKNAELSLDIEPPHTTYNSSREESRVSNIGAEELNCGNSIMLLTGVSGDDESEEEEGDLGSVHQDIVIGTETECYDIAIEDSEIESMQFTEVSVPQAAEDQVYSSASALSEVTWEEDPPAKTHHREACLNSDIEEINCENTVPVKLMKSEKVSLLHENDEGLTFTGSDEMKLIIDQLDQQIATAEFDGDMSQGNLPEVDYEIETDSEEEDEGKEIFDAEALAKLLRAAAGIGPDGRNVSIPLANNERVFSRELPTSSGSMFQYSENKIEGISEGILSDEEKKKLEKLHQLRVKFLQIIHRLNQSPEDSVAAQVLYQLNRSAGKSASQASSLDSAQKEAMELEAEDTESLNFPLNILVIGKTGVGKSATINSIFGQSKAVVDPFVPSTTHVKEICGQVDGVTLRILDTPGLRSSLSEQFINRRTLLSIKRYMKKCSPDVVLYVDRVDTQSRDLGDLPLLKSISSYLGSSIWRNTIITLTHASSNPPDGPSGYPVSYEMFVTQRSSIIQQLINHSVGDLNTINVGSMTPFSLVENHPLTPKNEKGEGLLPNGENWRSQLLLLCYSMKILSEIGSIMKDEDSSDHRYPFGFPIRSLPLPYFLSSLLQSNVHPKVNQGGDDMDSDFELAYSADSDQEVEEEYNDLPPFKPLRKSQIAKLSKEQKRAYFEEYDYRVKLFQKKQHREEIKRLRDMEKKKGKEEIGDYIEEGADQETGVAIPLPDMALPNSFDGDNPAYRYRFLEPSSQLVARPVMGSHGWDHDCGFDGVSIEDHLAIAGRFPAVIALQLTKDKKEFNIHLDSSVSAKTGEKGSTMVGFDIQTAGNQLAYILKGETKVKNLKKNKTAAGVSITFLGDNLVTGLKLEDQLAIGKELVVVGSTGTVMSRGNAAYGANMELRLRKKDYPVEQDQTSLSISLMKWRSDLIWGCNLQSQFCVGRNSKMAVRAGLNNKKSGQITVRTSTSDQLQIAILGLVPIVRAVMSAVFSKASENNLV